jgi:hypothetical protein
MAATTATTSSVLGIALGAGPALAALEAAEQLLSTLRTAAPDMAAAVHQALADAAGTTGAASPAGHAALAIAAAVDRHGAAFPPGSEPAYHDRHHQAEATRAMGWLAGAARQAGLLSVAKAELAVAAMAAHDLLHDGRVHAERGLLERRSADAAAAIARDAGMDAEGIALLRRIVLSTTWPWEEADAEGLACHLAREADLFGSALPRLGPRLSRLLAQELAAAGQPDAEAVATHVARVALLQVLPEPSASARVLGLEAARRMQLRAYAAVAERLALDPPGPQAGAAALDAMDAADAEALLAWSGYPA